MIYLFHIKHKTEEISYYIIWLFECFQATIEMLPRFLEWRVYNYVVLKCGEVVLVQVTVNFTITYWQSRCK